MGYLNKTMVIGNLGRDPELYNNDPNKAAFLTGSLAVDDSYTNKQTGEKVKRTVWYEFILNGKRAESFFQYNKKGATVYLEGELYEDEYASKLAPYPCYDAQGQPIVDAQGGHFHAYVQVVRKTKKLRVRDWKFMDSKKPDNTAYVAPVVAGAAPAPANVQATFAPQPVAPVFNPAAAVAPTTQPAVVATGQPAAPQFVVPVSNLPAGV